MTHGISLPKDTTPATAKRVAEAHGQSLSTAKVAVIARTVFDDPIVKAIVAVADTFPRDARNRAVETLHLIVLMDRTHHVLVDALKKIDDKNPQVDAIRRAIFDEWEAAIVAIIPARQITEAPAITALLKNPRYGENYYAEGMAAVRQAWSLCMTPADKKRFIEACLVGDKGYSKSSRHIAAWLPPSKVTTDVLVAGWLDRELNVSVFTNETLEGEPTSIGDQIAVRFRQTGAPPSDEEMYTMWASLLKDISDSKNLDARREALRALISQDAVRLIDGLRAVLPKAYQRVYELNASGLDGVYEKVRPPEELNNDPSAIITFKRKKAKELRRWIKHLQFSTPDLKGKRFGASFDAPVTLETQLDGIKLDPGIKEPGVLPVMELRSLKAEVNKRARERLGGPGVVLSTIDPKRLDAAIFVAEVCRQFDEEQRGLDESAAELESAPKSKLPAWPPK